VYKVTTSGKEFEVESGREGLTIDGEPLVWDRVKVADGYFHILIDNKSYRAEIVSRDLAAKTMIVKINGHVRVVTWKDKVDLLLEKMGMSVSGASKINAIKAPMPGLIIDLKVKTGDSVNAGDPLLILEAMKMENVIKSPGEGKVKSVRIKKGTAWKRGRC